MRHVILGTAGHIDHGKSSIVKALTGTDPDRLKEEKARGITIDLGFAELSYDDGITLGIVDVPGHEKLIKNMLAGAGGIDIVLFVIAADEGIMPQSREHLAICDLLNIKTGLVAVTKLDLVEPDWLDLVTDEIKGFINGTFLEGADIVTVSSKTGDNIELLKQKLHDLAGKVDPKRSKGMFRLPIDRVFTLKGFGTVVTGTALSGRLSADEKVEVQPAGISSKVRGLQTHGKSVEKAEAGQRVAINLQGVEKEDIKRGDVLVPPGRMVPTTAIDAEVELLDGSPDVKSRSQVHLHVGTAETVARIIIYEKDIIRAGDKAFCQFRLQYPVIAMSGDRFVIRRLSPVETIGGGAVLDPSPVKRKRKDGVSDLAVYSDGMLGEKLGEKIRQRGASGMTKELMEGWIDAQQDDIKKEIEVLKKNGAVILLDNVYVHKDLFNVMGDKIDNILEKYHKEKPLEAGMPKEVLRGRLRMDNRMFMSLISRISQVEISGDLVRKKGFEVAMSGADERTKEDILKMLENGGFKPPMKDDLVKELYKKPKEVSDILKLLASEGKAVRVNDSVYLSESYATELIKRVKDFFGSKDEMTVSELRDILGTSRKYALPFLEYLDTSKVTIRAGDVRKPGSK
ncbi:MAG: selenocysteine-specific translation elongation factor [Nitrospirota bacterium]|nr:MAG: selenocysteine-specific translation elongation factor [Nitrospirota bacterium]